MGQKVNPIGFRIGIYRDWSSRWFARRQNYAELLFEDLEIQKYIRKALPGAEISTIEIEKAGDNLRVIIHSGRPGVVIGKKGQEIDSLRKDLARLLKRTNVEVSVQEIKTPELDATIVSKTIAEQLEKRASFKKVMKKAATAAMKAGALGVKIRCAGRLGGAEIARDEWIRIGSTPLHTLRSDIDYGFSESHTTYGVIGVKVWICRGEYKLV
ncbi:30S ribosomal protein S3 [Candidatus Dependentiae bacterium]|nr:30S ribosomal protein S3 [Candidatus Dependentiae bacterium]